MRIDTSSIETGSSARISFGRSARAWAKPTRCRWPPLSSCGNRCEHLGGRGQADRVEHPLGLLAALLRRTVRGRCSLRQRMTPWDTRNTGLNEANGSWKTIGTSPR